MQALEREEEGLERMEIGVDPWRNGVEGARDLNWDKGRWRKAEAADIFPVLGRVWMRQKVHKSVFTPSRCGETGDEEWSSLTPATTQLRFILYNQSSTVYVLGS